MTIQTAHITDPHFTAHIGPHWSAWLYDNTGRCVAFAVANTEAEARSKVVSNDPSKRVAA